MKNERRIEYMPLSKLAKSGAKRNPKEHDIGAISVSVEKHGYVEPIVMDDRTSRLVAGHGRIETLQALKKEKKTPPDGVKVEKGEWLVPVARGWASKNDAQAEAYLLASNRLVELGGWNIDELEAVLSDLATDKALDGSGYDGDDLDRLLSAPEIVGGGTNPRDEWTDMPEFDNDIGSFRKLIVHFKGPKDVKKFEAAIGQKLPEEARFIWIPERKKQNLEALRFVENEKN